MAKSTLSVFFLFAISLFSIGCGSSSQNGNAQTPGAPIDPSGNWAMTFTDANNHSVDMSGLFSQSGSVVTALNILDAGNPAPFSCTGNMSMSNGQVLNVDQFSGDIAGGWGTLHFASTLNAAGTHASGTYTLTQGSESGCSGLAGSGTFSGDEIPSVTGSWTGTVTCDANCPTGSTSGTISMPLTQDDSSGAVTGTYTVTGLPGFTSGTIQGDQFSFLSGPNWQDNMTDNSGATFNGFTFVIAGGPVQGSTFNTSGFGLDRSFHGKIFLEPFNSASGTIYTVSMSH